MRVWSSPKGFPMARALCPTRKFFELPVNETKNAQSLAGKFHSKKQKVSYQEYIKEDYWSLIMLIWIATLTMHLWCTLGESYDTCSILYPVCKHMVYMWCVRMHLSAFIVVSVSRHRLYVLFRDYRRLSTLTETNWLPFQLGARR